MLKTKKHNIYKFILFTVFQFTYLFSQTTVEFFMAGQVADGDDIYNINSTQTTNGPYSGSNAGGIYLKARELEYAFWDVQVSFDGGAFGNINGDGSNDSNPDDNGQVVGNSTVRPNDTPNGDLNIWFSHAEIAASTGYPGTVDGSTMQFQIKKADNSTLPSSGETYQFDLIAPTITSAAIESDNSDDSWATIGDNITITLTAPSGSGGENLGTSDQWTASIQDLAATVGGSGLTWTVSATVSSHSEGPARFSITYYDAYENPGTTLIDVLGNSSSVTIDKTAPNITA
ncbi:hypothetical protein N8331_00635, partial [bacterium]|nr:hypothetical protein [bacterium]